MVYLVDDNHPFRRSTALVLETSGIEVRDFDSAEALLAELEKDPAAITDETCVVSDMRMPGMSGLALLEEMQRRKYEAPVIFITAHGDIALAVEAMRRGAANFIEKPFTVEVLIQAIQLATVKEPPPTEEQDPRIAALSDREKQVLELVVAGKANKVIGDILGISTKTVELHRGSLMTKVGVRTVPDLVKVFLGYKK